MQPQQLPLFPAKNIRPFNYPFPTTRYQGSKRKLVNWIWEQVRHLEFTTVLDVFGGTGVVSHLFKNAGKHVTYNDIMAFNCEIGRALIENRDVVLTPDEVDQLLTFRDDVHYPDFIQKHFSGIYFTDEENAWLDRVNYQITHMLNNRYKQAIARFALFQACIIKRPYNLFHRANLYMRTADVDRSFGNKRTWDTPFETHFRQFVIEANAAVFDNGYANEVLQCDALATPTGYDLVYIDPPYLNKKGVGVDYRDFYHFLEGLMMYDEWEHHIDYGSKHRRLKPQKSLWNDATTIMDAFTQLVQRHQNSILVISYRDDGIPTREALLNLLSRYKKHVYEVTHKKQYALAHKKSAELLLIAL